MTSRNAGVSPAGSAASRRRRKGAETAPGQPARTPALHLFESTIADLLGRGIGVRFRAAGGSMHPAIRCGQHVEVMPVDAAALACGDVVLTRQRRGLTAHRIVRIHENRITTRGDSCSENDPELCAADILGRVVGIPSRSRARARHWVRRALTIFSR